MNMILAGLFGFSIEQLWTIIAAVIVFVMGFVFKAISKTVIFIYNKGRLDTKHLATKQEMEMFKSEVREDLRHYKAELTDILIRQMNDKVNDRLEDITEIKKLRKEIEEELLKLDLERDQFNKYVERIDEMAEMLRTINNKLERLENEQRVLTGSSSGITRRRG